MGSSLCYLHSGFNQGKADKLATYKVEYTLPGELGKIRTKTFASAADRDTGIAKLKEKGAKIKATVRMN